MVTLSRSIPILYFCIRVLFFAIVASPVYAQGAGLTQSAQQLPELPSPELSAPADAEPTPANQYNPKPSSSPSELNEYSVQKPATKVEVPSEVSESPTGSYWIVSSRRAVQNVHQTNRGAWHLDVFTCQPGATAVASNLDALSQQLLPGVPVCIFSHGSFVQWENHWKQSNQAFVNLNWATGNKPVQYIFYSWPSDGPYSHIPQVDVAVRGKRAEFNGLHLANLVSYIPESCPVTLVGHSHGTRVVLSALELAAGGSVQGLSLTKSVGQQRRMRVVLAAGALDHHWLNPGQRYGLALNRVECLLNLRNQNDLPLAFYTLSRPFARRPIARLGITSKDSAAIGGYNAAKIRQVDVTNLLGGNHYWPYYYGNSQILAAVAPYLASF